MTDDFYIFIAARLKSKRLPKKAMIKIGEKTVVQHLVERLADAVPKEKIVLCTSKCSSDDKLIGLAKSLDVHHFRGHPTDVMKRFLDAADHFKATTIARVTGDNPLTDPFELKNMYDFHVMETSEYTYNDELPIGTRSEIIDVQALKRIHPKIVDPLQSEYMTYMLNQPDRL